jgi:hypothetical protein
MSNGHGTASHGAQGETAGGAKKSVALIGFIVVAVLGIAIAIYASRFVPGAISGLAGAGAYVSNLFILENEDGTGTVEEKPVQETPAVKPPAPVATSTPTAPATPRPTTPRPATPVYSGLSDLTVNIATVGYCTTGAQNSLVSSSYVPDNARYGGVRFTVTNIGTNVSGPWAFEIETSASPSDTYEYAGQASLAPGQSMVGTMCFPRGTRANDGEVTITVDSQDRVVEGNERNNEASQDLEIESWED